MKSNGVDSARIRARYMALRLGRRNRCWLQVSGFSALGVIWGALIDPTLGVLYFACALLFYYLGRRPRSRDRSGPSLAAPFARFMQTVEGRPEPVMVLRTPDADHRSARYERYVGTIDGLW